ncbi:MAG: MATE family efflux transporter [Cyanobacteria bacterium SBLK]|nr:MATE family efflux transporter [Cyanobacteria bacterium SBLK]
MILSEKYNFLPRFYRLAAINILSNLIIPLAGLISTAFLGHLQEIRSLAGVALASILFNSVYFTLLFLRMATTGVTAQAVGRDDREEMLLIGLRNGLIAFAIGVLIVIFQQPLREIGFALLSATPEIKLSGVEYYNTRIWGAPAVLVNFVLLGWLLGREKNTKVLILSIFGNAANIIFDYLFIIYLHWNSAGAGLSQAISQYLMLAIALFFASQQVQWQEIVKVFPKIFDLAALKEIFAFNMNLFLRTFISIVTFTIFNDLSATLGTIIFVDNTLILQMGLVTVYFIDGMAYAIETLTGNFLGQGEREKFWPLMQVALGTSLPICLSFATICELFPQTIFGFLTDRIELTEHINIYTPWLFCLLGLPGIATLFEGYFLGLARGDILRNAVLISLAIGFTPMAIVGWYFQSNHLLWLAISLFLTTKTIALIIPAIRSLRLEKT